MHLQYLIIAFIFVTFVAATPINTTCDEKAAAIDCQKDLTEGEHCVDDIDKDGRCKLKKEDNEHVWNCSSAVETTTTIWKEALRKVDERGVQAPNSYNAASA
ncbi:hypothetical protein BKA57DRAFT_511686 [Linnemannia elongata]|nr:hypothetical protein BKA57DRAFT_511686 [Linnemannia elongata]